jgi:phosphoribosylglycinamide formyltransferase 1
MILGVLASGEGTILQAVLDACRHGRLDASVGLVISNNSKSGALRRAAAAGVPSAHLSSKTHPDPQLLDETIALLLKHAQVDLVLLAGFMKKLGSRTLTAYAGRILNTHPALLPKFGGPGMYGDHVHRAVLGAGELISGATVHLVVAEYDAGPIISQRIVEVHRDDMPEVLSLRVQAAERDLVVDTLQAIARGDLGLIQDHDVQA